MTPETRQAAAKLINDLDPKAIAHDCEEPDTCGIGDECGAWWRRWPGIVLDAVAPLLEGPLQREVEELRTEVDGLKNRISGQLTEYESTALLREVEALRQELNAFREIFGYHPSLAEARGNYVQLMEDRIQQQLRAEAAEAQLAAANERIEKARHSIMGIEREGLREGSVEFWNAVTGALAILSEGRPG